MHIDKKVLVANSNENGQAYWGCGHDGKLICRIVEGDIVVRYKNLVEEHSPEWVVVYHPTYGFVDITVIAYEDCFHEQQS